MGLLKCTATLLGSNGHGDSCHVVLWGVLLQCTARLLGSSGQWISCCTLPHCWGSMVCAVCCGVVCCVLAWRGVPKALLPKGNGQDVYPRVQINGRAVCLSARCVLVCRCTAGTYALSHLAGTVLPTPMHGHTGSKGPTAPCVLCCTISLLCAVPHCLVLCSALHCVCLAALHLWAVGSGQWNFCYALPHCPGAVGSATPALHSLTACGQWAAKLLLCTATLSGGSELWNSCNALPHCLGAVGNATPVVHRHTAWGQWAVQLLQYTTSLPGGSGQCNSNATLPRAVGSGTPVMHRLTTWGQWAVQLLSCTASLPGGSGHCLGGSGQWNSCHAPPHCVWAVSSATPAMHCLTACGRWAVQLVHMHCHTA